MTLRTAPEYPSKFFSISSSIAMRDSVLFSSTERRFARSVRSFKMASRLWIFNRQPSMTFAVCFSLSSAAESSASMAAMRRSFPPI